MDNIYKTEHTESMARNSEDRRTTTFQNSNNKKVWFAGLYIASLLCLTVTGASVRWMLYSL